MSNKNRSLKTKMIKLSTWKVSKLKCFKSFNHRVKFKEVAFFAHRTNANYFVNKIKTYSMKSI